MFVAESETWLYFSLLMAHACACKLCYAQTIVDVYIDQICGAIKGQIPDVLDDHRSGYPPAGVAHEIFQQRKLLRCQLDPTVSTGDPAFHPIEFKVLNRQDGLC